jgi:hypothetical protein
MSTSLKHQTRTPGQQMIVQQLVDRWKIDPNKILFLKSGKPLEPWLNYEALTVIARSSGRFRSLSEQFSTFVPGLNHLIHIATVVDSEGFEYTRSGAAEIGETVADDEDVDEHSLAATRALRSALDSAGFDVVKGSSVIPIDLNVPKLERTPQDEPRERINELRLLHLLAAQKGLIKPADEDPSRNDMSAYRRWLADNFDGAGSAAGFSAANRAIAINKLRLLPDAAEKADTRSN